jgi:hypothetical protein
MAHATNRPSPLTRHIHDSETQKENQMDLEQIEAITGSAIERARSYFERLGVLATDDAVAARAFDDPAMQALMNYEDATRLMTMKRIEEIIADIPPQAAAESQEDYLARVMAAVRAEIERGHPLDRFKQENPT